MFLLQLSYYIPTIILLIVSAFAYLLYKIFVYPPLKMRMLKQKYKDRIYTYYFPILGWFKLFTQYEEQYNDASYHLKKMVMKNPKLECFVTNLQKNMLYVLISPELVKQYYQNTQYYKKNSLGYFMGEYIKEGIANQEGAKWKKTRSQLAPHFNFQQIIDRFDMMNNQIKGQIDQLNIDYKFDNSSIDISENLRMTAAIISLKSFFSNIGEKSYHLVESVEELACRTIQIILKSKYLGMKLLLFGDLGTKFFRNKEEQTLYNDIQMVKQQFDNLINERLEYNINNIHPINDFLDVQLSHKDFNKKQIIDNFITLYFAGTDTTSNSFVSILYYLSIHKEVQTKLRQEIYQVIGKDVNNFKGQHLKELTYLQCIIWETLRLSNPANVNIMREAVQDHKLGDYRVKKGDLINVSNLGMNYNPEQFPEPEKFLPERWKNKQNNTSTNQSFNFAPFASGKRNCIGQHFAQMELKIFTVRYLLEFELYIKKDYKPIYWQKSTYQIKNPDFLILSKLKQ